MSFNKVIIWGFKPNTHDNGVSHTHSYIHQSYYKAFKHLGYDTYWFDDTDDVSGVNFDNCLFFTEGQTDSKMPVNDTSKYILHNCGREKYEGIKVENKILLQFFQKDVLGYTVEKINDYTYYGDDILYVPWATNLLPHEIDLNTARNEKNNKVCFWAGSYTHADTTAFENHTALDPFFDEARKLGLSVVHANPWVNPVSNEENRRLVNCSFVAPSINGKHQRDTYYLSCRLFKNISYGHLGITNSMYANKIFNDRLVYDPDTAALFHKSVEKKNQPGVLNEIKELMNEVKEKHTFVNRIHTLLNCFK